jgi:two-component system, OmpR family, response regulator
MMASHSSRVSRIRVSLVQLDRQQAEALARLFRGRGHTVRYDLDLLTAAGDPALDLFVLATTPSRPTSMVDLRALRKGGDARPVVLIASTAPELLGCAFDAGADDVVDRPGLELVLRAEVAVRRRLHGAAREAGSLGALSVDESGRFLSMVDGRWQAIALGGKELGALSILWSRRGGIVTKHRLFEAVWGSGSEVDPHAVDGLIYRLRRKMGSAGRLLVTESGIGYRLRVWGRRGGGGSRVSSWSSSCSVTRNAPQAVRRSCCG